MGAKEETVVKIEAVTGPKTSKQPLVIDFILSPVLSYWLQMFSPVSYTHLRAHETEADLVCRLLLEADADAEYFEVIDIDLAEIKEPLLACPNDPDDVKTLSDVAGDKIDEVFIGSCMTNIGHYRAAASLIEKSGDYLNTVLWIAPPTRMDEHQLKEEGHYNVFGRVGARLEIPGCSLCTVSYTHLRAHEDRG